LRKTVWGERLLGAYQLIVGYANGIDMEGCSQWYYFLSLAMINTLTWWLRPELGLLFSICSGLHFVMVCLYGLLQMDERKPSWSLCCFVLNLAMFVVCLYFDWLWTLGMSAIVALGFILAPDDNGCNIFTHDKNDLNKFSFGWALFFHTLWFAAFVTIMILVPIATWLKFVGIVAAIFLHPLMDYMEGECMSLENYAYGVLDAFCDEFDK
jgi:hypothetical protein